MTSAPTPSDRDREPGSTVLWALALATVITLLSTFETIMFSRMANRPVPAWMAFVMEGPQWYGWALLTPLVVLLSERFPIRRPVRASNVLVHVVTMLVAAALVATGDAVVGALFRPPRGGLLASMRSWFMSGLPISALVYCAILGVAYALRNARLLRERERAAAELETQLREAQLGALRMQLQPHFLFNSLNAIMALVRDQDTPRAIRSLSLLSDVLRATINAGDAHQTTLDQEIDFVCRYLEIERVRFGDRLRVTMEVPEQLRDARVPTFILQPFVENALKHGVLRERAGNEIAIRASQSNGSLHLAVRDDGRGLSTGGAASTGVGISNARARLQQMYGGAAQLSIANASPGVSVEITLPLSR